MKREVTGHYIPLPSAAGEKVCAFIPTRCSPLELGAYIQKLAENAIQTLAKPESAQRVHRLVEVQSILSIATPGKELKLSVRALTSALNHLVKLGIARETTDRNYGRVYAYDKYLNSPMRERRH